MLGTEDWVDSVAFSPDGQTLAAGYRSPIELAFSGVVLWDLATRRRRLAEEPLRVPEGTLDSIAFSPDGQTLAAGYREGSEGSDVRDGGVVLWDLTTRRLMEDPFPVPEGKVDSIAFSPDG